MSVAGESKLTRTRLIEEMPGAYTLDFYTPPSVVALAPSAPELPF